MQFPSVFVIIGQHFLTNGTIWFSCNTFLTFLYKKPTFIISSLPAVRMIPSSSKTDSGNPLRCGTRKKPFSWRISFRRPLTSFPFIQSASANWFCFNMNKKSRYKHTDVSPNCHCAVSASNSIRAKSASFLGELSTIPFSLKNRQRIRLRRASLNVCQRLTWKRPL